MKTLTISYLIFTLTSLSLSAQSLPSIRKDLDDAQSRLTKQREKVAVDKPALGRLFHETRTLLNQRRREARVASILGASLNEDLTSAEKDYEYTSGLVRDYGLRFETFLLPGERDAYREKLPSLSADSGTPAERLKVKLASLEAGIAHLEKVMGGHLVEGDAVASDGEVKSGTFALAGPAIWFAAEDSSATGAVIREKGSLSPRVIKGDAVAVKSLISGEAAQLGLDVTGGKALALTALQNDEVNIFRKGGFWIWPILAIALFSMISGVIKFFQIIKLKTPRADWVSDMLTALRDGDQAQAESISQEVNHPVSAVVSRCLTFVKAGPDVVEEVLYEQLIDVQNKLQSWLPFIAITAATAPLLGLLGTVAGMIRTFEVIAISGTGDAKPLAGGISEALVTTLFGLVVAIPALIIHALLSRRCQGIAQTTEKLGLTLVNGLRGERFKSKNDE
ncbi:MotA/TolQ/ExbB proton channel family protein [Akkermansiaceae bacterium]|nr:MotA/TolQ/ExbB proton channel family protein [Akkermansiaceae bacterium]